MFVRKMSKKSLFASVLGVVGVTLLVIATLGLIDYFRTTQSGIDTPTLETVQSDDVVSEKSVTVTDTGYTVPTDQPRVIEIPSINAKGYVQKVGVLSDGVMAAPNNINFAGWYTSSPTPGSEGVSIINGHAGGRYTDGIFRNINKLTKDDTVRVQMGDMLWRTFKVVSVNSYDVKEAAGPLFTQDPAIGEALHLITCDGVFDDTSQTYDKRVVLVARFVNE